MNDLQFQGIQRTQTKCDPGQGCGHDTPIDPYPRAQPEWLWIMLLFQHIKRLVADEPLGSTHLHHDLVTGVDTQRAHNATFLLAVADIHTGGTDRNTLLAVHTISGGSIILFLALLDAPSRFPTIFIVSWDHGGLVDHHALDTSIRA